MDAAIEFLRGPLFRFSLAVLLLGLSRHVILSAIGFWRARSRAGQKEIQFGTVVAKTVSTLNPIRYMLSGRWLYTVLSVVFHIGLILVPLLFLGHIRLWERGVGLSWPGLPNTAADVLTWLTILTGVALLTGRAAFKDSREMSRAQDWVLPPLRILPWRLSRRRRRSTDERCHRGQRDTVLHHSTGSWVAAGRTCHRIDDTETRTRA